MDMEAYFKTGMSTATPATSLRGINLPTRSKSLAEISNNASHIANNAEGLLW